MTTVRAARERDVAAVTPRGLTEHRVQTWCVWSAPLFVALLFGALLVAGWVPPPSPSQTPGQVAAMYAEHTDLKRLAFVLLFLGGGMSAAFVAAIDHRLEQIPGARALARLQVIGGTLGVFAVVLPAIVFMVAAYRPERNPEITQALHDLAFIPFIGNLVPFLIQAIAIGVAVLMQDPERPVLPRWVGFYNLWTAFLTLPGLLLIFFRTGAFAWNGVLVFWVVATVFGGWFLVMFWVLRDVLRAEAR
ncbi:hypothetical protein LQ327_14615 [Actinomycetospora endophytica]|uniref:Uncharacterized protein n=1 Tax=Actinomycetospora endophytica TaxID=2291215 RepID=A0ABS8P8L6_9PSEU|nr:hypothetical protein [Actinomycetospora endophytica]MCD2194603.1 hypothetical protein [Actinomycetospora endophytica]